MEQKQKAFVRGFRMIINNMSDEGIWGTFVEEDESQESMQEFNSVLDMLEITDEEAHKAIREIINMVL